MIKTITMLADVLIEKPAIEEIKQYTRQFLFNNLSVDIIHHNWEAVQEHVAALDKISLAKNVTQTDKQVAEVAFYFLYTGLTEGYDNYNILSQKIATKYLSEHKFEASFIEAVNGCLKIYNTKSIPNTVAQEIFLDSASAHFGEKKLHKRIKKTWEEELFLRGEQIDLIKKLENARDQLNDHKFYTSTAKKLYAYRKQKNIRRLNRAVTQQKSDNRLTSNKMAMTMIKTALRNHIDLVNIADKKAGIMISINAILMTIMIPILGSYIIDVSQFLIPSIILITTCGLAVILAALATRPQIGTGRVEKTEGKRTAKSLFYFGNFFKMEKEAYSQAIKKVILRDQTLENSAINDLYDLGVILGVKYRRLRWCYIIFAVGIASTMLSFLVSFFIVPQI